MLIDMYMSGDNKPIGWWIKEADRLLELSFEQVLAADGVNRRQWQALNAARGEEPIAVALAPFLAGTDDNQDALAAITGPLVARGWLDEDDRLTRDGEAAFVNLSEKVRAERRRIRNGIVDSEYLQTVDVLRRMVANLSTNGSAA